MTNKACIKSATVAKKAAKKTAVKRGAAKAAKPRKTAPQSRSRKAESRPCSPAATLRSRRPTATPPYRPLSRPCRAGNARSGAASTRSSCAPSPARARPSNGIRRCMGWKGQGWFVSFRCFTKYVKVAFFRGASLRPAPPGGIEEQGRAVSRYP
jgi:hypothetical protein